MLPGFKVVLGFNPLFAIKPEDAYLSALDFMYKLTYAGWEGTIASGYEAFTKEVNEIIVGVGSLAQPGALEQLQNKHVALGLLRMLNYSASKNRFCFTKAALYLRGKHIGVMAIGLRVNGMMGGNNGSNDTLGIIDTTAGVTVSRSLPSKGTVVDPDDSDFVIAYQMERDRIPCQSLLNAALNAMVLSGVKHNTDLCTDFAGFNSAMDVTVSITRGARGTTVMLLNYVLVRTALKLLPARLYEKGTCGAVKFQLNYGGEMLGSGYIRLSDF